MIEETDIVPAKSGSPVRVIGFLALGLVIGIGGTLLLQKKRSPVQRGTMPPKRRCTNAPCIPLTCRTIPATAPSAA